MMNRPGQVSALLLAGGVGSRLRPLTDSIPKCLVEIAGRPLLGYWIDRLIEAQIHEARVNTHALADQVRAFIDRVNIEGPLRLVESHEPELLGSAGTVRANADLADAADQIVIIYADNLSNIDLRPLLDFHRSHGDPFTMVLFHAPNPRACGIAELDADGLVTSFKEKPEQPTSDLANAGLYVVDAALYREIANRGGFDIGFDVLPQLVGRMRGWVWGGYHLDIGTLSALDQAREDAPKVFAVRRADEAGPHPAVFLDRDGTVIKFVHYLSKPDEVELLADAAESLTRLKMEGLPCVIVTNQSAIGRGMITEAELHQIHAEMNRQLAARGVSLDGIYYCPEVPSGGDPTVVEHPSRKPGPGMLLQAAEDLGLDIGRSWMVGDQETDVLAGLNAGCRSIQVGSARSVHPQVVEAMSTGRCFAARDLTEATQIILNNRGHQQ
jgi:mannose-1-phosphate guanylyltransferase